MYTVPLLSILIFLPILSGALLLCLPETKNGGIHKSFAMLIALLCFTLSCILLYYFDPSLLEMQWTEHHAWIPSFGIYYNLGVDGFSLPLITLTCFMTILVVLASVTTIVNRVRSYLPFITRCSSFTDAIKP